MRYSVISILMMCVIISCIEEKPLHDSMEIIEINTQQESCNISSFIEKIEIVPLETTEHSLFHKMNKVIFNNGMDICAILTGEQDVFTFNGDGKYIANSKMRKGDGPEEYSMITDIRFSKDNNSIELLNPYGLIYSYTATFDFLSRTKINTKIPIRHIIQTDSTYFIMTHHSLWTGEEVTFYNQENDEYSYEKYKGTISAGNGINKDNFHQTPENIYFVPHGINYYLYQVDNINKKIVPKIYLDFGDETIKEKGLPGVGVGKKAKVEGNMIDLSNEYIQRHTFLRKSNYIIPLIKLVNDKYVYIYMAKGNESLGSHYLYNREEGKGFLTKDSKSTKFGYCNGINENVLFFICQPFELPYYIDFQLMSNSEIEKISAIKEDDNPIIIKYYLK